MLEYICDNHIEEYDWFVRAVDDVYIKPDRLLALLANVDKNRMVYTTLLKPVQNLFHKIRILQTGISAFRKRDTIIGTTSRPQRKILFNFNDVVVEFCPLF